MHSYCWQNVHHEGCSPQVLYLAIDFDISLVDRMHGASHLEQTEVHDCKSIYGKAFTGKISSSTKNAANQNPISPFGAINLNCKPIINTQQIQISTVKVN